MTINIKNLQVDAPESRWNTYSSNASVTNNNNWGPSPWGHPPQQPAHPRPGQTSSSTMENPAGSSAQSPHYARPSASFSGDQTIYSRNGLQNHWPSHDPAGAPIRTPFSAPMPARSPNSYQAQSQSNDGSGEQRADSPQFVYWREDPFTGVWEHWDSESCQWISHSPPFRSNILSIDS
ncbi:hypothetical protein BDN72DRAFT_964255 [Pluteus cervinus]|uniref:Uncharacterized protein n=1 Tax=Pluteus cervinus TaxID=181527 RepID=A0ACD3AAM1_9AGAR|nr:hypothetical protein BDN72DRAFT_964255 [Pluteus cervinus]